MGIAAQMDGGVADDAGHRAFVAVNEDAAAAGGGRIRAADAVDAQKPVVIHLLDHVADLVGMGFEHHDALGLAGQDGPSGAVGVAADLRRVVAHPVCPDALAGHFEAGRAGGFEQPVEKLAVVLFHAAS